MTDTLQSLQHALSNLKRRYEAGSPSRDRDDAFAQEEAALGERFRRIGHAPSYPPRQAE